MPDGKDADQRRLRAEQLLVSQYSNFETARILVEQGATPVQAWNAIHAAWKRWEACSGPDMVSKRERHLSALRALFRDAIKAEERAEAISVLREIAAIEGLYMPKQVELEVNKPVTQALTSEEKRKRFYALIAARGMRLVPMDESTDRLLPSAKSGKSGNGSNGSGTL